MTTPVGRRGSAGFTLVELLVVIAIIVLVSAATIPAILPALEQRQVLEASRVFQAALGAARDSAIRADSPRGIRLLPDSVLFPDQATISALSPPTYRSARADLLADDRKAIFASSSFIPIETGPAYSEGLVRYVEDTTATLPRPTAGSGVIVIEEVKYTDFNGVTLPAPPTSWYWNIRAGERIRLEGLAQSYIIRGPMLIPPGPENPEGFINAGAPSATNMGPTAPPQVLILSNGIDDDGDGFADEGFDGIKNGGPAGDPADPGNNSIDENGDNQDGPTIVPPSTITGRNFVSNLSELYVSAAEVEPENAFGRPDLLTEHTYTIERRPVPTQGARATTLPGEVVIDLTTWNYVNPERSRLPVDQYTGYVDILLAPNGQVIPSYPGRAIYAGETIPFYHFWLTERDDVYPPSDPAFVSTGISRNYFLPMPEGTPNRPTGDIRSLKGERRLVTLFTKTGLLVTNPLDSFDADQAPLPYQAAQAGVREAR